MAMGTRGVDARMGGADVVDAVAPANASGPMDGAPRDPGVAQAAAVAPSPTDVSKHGTGCTTPGCRGFTFHPSRRCDACRRKTPEPKKEHERDDR
jgi:hypothetical protein